MTRYALLLSILCAAAALPVRAQDLPPGEPSPVVGEPPNRAAPAAAADITYRVGAEDVLAISVLHAPELTTSVRVSPRGEISLPLLGAVAVAGLTASELETELENRLRERYIRDPDVTVQVTELQSQAISVMGAVRTPGIFQVRGTKTLLEVLSLAGGLAEDAGDSVIVLRRGVDQPLPNDAGAAASEDELASGSFEVSLKELLDSQDGSGNVPIHPGDVVNVRSAAIVYVVGALKKPGAFAMRGNDRLTVLRALALGEGLLPWASKDAMVLRTNDAGARVEIPVHLGDVMKGKQQDFALQAQDVLFVPTSGTKAVTRVALEMLTRIVTLRGVF